MIAMHELIEEVDCLLCGGGGKRVLLVKPPFRIVACRACGLIYTDRRFTEAGMAAYYAKGYFTGEVAGAYRSYVDEEREKAVDFDAKYLLLRRFAPGGTALDVGCALGFSLDAAARAGFSPVGLERSAWAVENRRTSFPIQKGTFDDLEAKAAFDVVTMWDVMEHLPAPKAIFDKLAEVVRPGGLFAATYPDPDSVMARMLGRFWPPFTPEEHVFFPTSSVLKRELGRVGFTLLDRGWEKRAFSLGKLRQKLKGAQGALPGGRIVTVPIPYKRLAIFQKHAVEG
jgi:SAM-dependent methyltransferase